MATRQTNRSRARSAARLAAVQALYQQEMEGTAVARLLAEFHNHRLGATIEDVTYADAEVDFFDDVVKGVLARRDELDGLIAAKLAAGWTLDRLDRPMRQILRCGAYELVARIDVPTASVISEYLDVADAFYDRREKGFANGLLDAIAKDVRGGARLDEAAFIDRLRAFATDPAARGLIDDAAVLTPPPGRAVVLTTDMLVEGVHYLPDDPPADVAWKLVAVNLSDLAAKGAEPLGVLLGYPLGGDCWDAAFADGLEAALAQFRVALLGGDTVAAHGPRTLSLTAIGAAPEAGAPSRARARAGDALWVSGTIGDAGIGLDRARRGAAAEDPFVRRYRRPEPRLAAGQALAPLVTAMSDVSDGLLIDAARMAAASGVGIAIDLGAVPVSDRDADRAGRLAAATAGDDYELLFAADPARAADIVTLSQSLGLTLTRIGQCVPGAGLRLHDAAGAVPLPARLGYEHAADDRDVGD